MTPLQYFINRLKLDKSDKFYELIKFTLRYYEEQEVPSDFMLKKLSVNVDSLPVLVSNFDVDKANTSLKNFIYLCNKSDSNAFKSSNECSDNFIDLIYKLSDKIRSNSNGIERISYFIVIVSFYILKLDLNSNFNWELDNSGILECLSDVMPFILAEQLNRATGSAVEYPNIMKGFFVPQGYRLEITHEDKGTQTINAGEYSGSNYDFDDILQGKLPDWILVKTDNTPEIQPQNTSQPEQATAQNAIEESLVEQFANGMNIMVPVHSEHAASLGLMDVPEDLVIYTLARLLKVNNGQELYNVMLGNHPDIPHEEVKTALGLDTSGSVYICMFLEDEELDGPRVDMQRRISSDGKIVSNESLFIDPTYQGQGIGRAIYSSQESHWKQIGVEKVTLHANADVGGYAWAKLGYDFSIPENSIPAFKSRAERMIGDIAPYADIEFDEVEEMYLKVDRCSTAQDFCNLDLKTDVEELKDFGKKLMLGQSWQGHKIL